MSSGVMTSNLLLLMVVLPLVGALLTYAAGARSHLSGEFAALFSLLAFEAALIAHFGLTTLGVPFAYVLAPWITVGDIQVRLGFRLDNLASVMCLVVTGVGTLIHIYAIGYMRDDRHQPRFFAYLNLFLAAMLTLVLADNLLVMFIGWEGVGLCSYLLIGFWYEKMPNAEAGQKAFIVNRIGDAAFLLGVFTLAAAAHTLDFAVLASTVKSLPAGTLELVALLLFIGATGKSAQLPLAVWLPDAMAGPTPVSALIHAATMVTAGVYMVARLGFLYTLAPQVLSLILIVGTVTALFAATVALVQTDIKRVLAYSTISQLGFMFIALGVGAFSYAIFHVVTHAFFKAGLFLAAGSVITALHHEQDMRRYGGLWRAMPVTFAVYLVSTLAIGGIPGLAGAYSKDAILWSLASAPQGFGAVPLAKICLAVALVTAGLTAFYMTRSLVLTFFGEFRGSGHLPQESARVMTIPLIVLALLAAGFGAIGSEALLVFLRSWTRPDLLELAGEAEHAHKVLERIISLIAFGAVAFALLVYLRVPALAALGGRTRLYEVFRAKWWLDELYQRAVVAPLRASAELSFTLVDRLLIDGSVDGIGALARVNAGVLRRWQSGQAGDYLLWISAGTVVLLTFWLL